MAPLTLGKMVLKFSMTVMCSSDVPGGVSMIKTSRSIHATSVKNWKQIIIGIRITKSAEFRCEYLFWSWVQIFCTYFDVELIHCEMFLQTKKVVHWWLEFEHLNAECCYPSTVIWFYNCQIY